MFWNIVGLIISFGLNLILSPKPQNAKPTSLEDFSIPRAEEGAELPVLFGTKELTGPLVHWFGDPLNSPRTSGRKYGFFGPKNVIGYWYHLGIHMILCHGVPDALYEVRVGGKVLWRGVNTGGRITVEKKSLFGGNNAEGGISGSFDVEFGEPTQGRNDYLESVLGPDIPAFRGVVGIVLRRMYVGTTAYIKPWSFKLQRVYKRSDGTDQWYRSKAGIVTGTRTKRSLYFALDNSGSMETVDPGQTLNRWQILLAAMDAVLDRIKADVEAGLQIDIGVCTWSGGITDEVRYLDASASDIDAIKAFLAGENVIGGTDFNIAANYAHAWWTDSLSDPDIRARVFVFITDGLPDGGGDGASAAAILADELSSTGGSFNTDDGTVVQCFGINIVLADTSETAFLDNTPADGVPVATDEAGLQAAIDAALYADQVNVDMNVVHMIRECMTDPVWGMGYPDANFDEASWTAAADRAYQERFGLTLEWNREEKVDEFVRMLQAYADAYVFIDRSTGKWKIRLIRDDYDPELIPVFTEADIVDWSELSRRQPWEAPASLTVRYYNRKKRREAGRILHYGAARLLRNGSINVTRQYPGIQTTSLAARVAKRDLKSLRAGLASGRLLAKRTMEGLEPGDPFWLVSEERGLSTIMRLIDMRLGDGRQNTLTLQVAEDVFSIDDELLIEVDDDDDDEEDLEDTPLAATPRLAWEMPYAELVAQVGSTDAATILAGDPDAGLLQVSAGRPSGGALSAILAVDAGPGYEDVGTVYFAPAATLTANLSATATTATVVADAALDIDEIEVGALAVIGSEIVRIDGYTAGVLTLGRGCLDSLPAAHLSGEKVLIYSQFNLSDFEVYTAAAALSAKLRTVTSSGELTEAEAPADLVTFDSRARRPLRPANVQVNGDHGFGGVVDAIGVPVEVTFVTRDRLAETGAGVNAWSEGSVAAEAGQTTVIEMRDADTDALLQTYSGVTSPYTVPDADYAAVYSIKLKVLAERDGVRSLTGHEITVDVAVAPPVNLTPPVIGLV